jgi:hypothetical protein
MDTPVNLEDPVRKIVGRRTGPVNPLRYASGLQRTMHRLAPLRVPRGVYRFKSHEEADEWMMNHLTRKQGD